MGYINKVFLETQFQNFANRIAQVFAKKSTVNGVNMEGTLTSTSLGIVWTGTHSNYERDKSSIPNNTMIVFTDDNVEGTLPTKLSELEDDDNHKLVTKQDIENWNANNHYGTYSDFQSIQDSLPIGASFDITDSVIVSGSGGSSDGIISGGTISGGGNVIIIGGSSNKEDNNSNYVMEETVIGTFMGKPLYRKCYLYNRDITSSSYVSMSYFTDSNQWEYIVNVFAVGTKTIQSTPCRMFLDTPKQVGISSMATINGDSDKPIMVFVEYTKIVDGSVN